MLQRNSQKTVECFVKKSSRWANFEEIVRTASMYLFSLQLYKNKCLSIFGVVTCPAHKKLFE